MVKINKIAAVSIYNKALEEEDYEQTLALEKQIIATHNAKYIYKFACNVLGTDRTNLTNGIIKANNPLYVYYFARDVKNLTKEHILKLENCIINSADYEIMLMFARDIDRADIHLISTKVMTAPKYDDIINYMRFVKLEGSDICFLNMRARSIIYEEMNEDLKKEYWSTIHEIFDEQELSKKRSQPKNKLVFSSKNRKSGLTFEKLKKKITLFM